MQRYYHEWLPNHHTINYVIFDRHTGEQIATARELWQADMVVDALNKAYG